MAVRMFNYIICSLYKVMKGKIEYSVLYVEV